MTLKLIFTTNTSQSLKNKQKIPGEEGERGFKSMKDIKNGQGLRWYGVDFR